MQKSTIKIDVSRDPQKMISGIHWNATDSTADAHQAAKAMILSFWDGQEKSAMRIDLWTKDMMIDEMGDFFYQTMMVMADTYGRATQQKELAEDLKKFAADFYKKSRALLEKQQ